MTLRKYLFVVPLAAALVAPLAAQKTGTGQKPRLSFMDQNAIAYIRPGITVKVVSAAVAQDGTITARAKIADPKGIPLDIDGINTAGPVTLRFIAAYIPAGQKQYMAYTTAVLKATLNTNPPQIQAATDSGGTLAKNAEGDYTYTFKTKAPAGFDPTVTHAIGAYATRNLSEFMKYEEWSEAANDVYNFVPNGTPVTVTTRCSAMAARASQSKCASCATRPRPSIRTLA
jgi:OmcA/MtrC family decaheme c-type cytochrome